MILRNGLNIKSLVISITACMLQYEINKPLEFPEDLAYKTVRVEGITVGNTKIYNWGTHLKLRCYSLHSDAGTRKVSGLLPCTLYNKNISIPEGSRVIIHGKIKRYRYPFKSLVKKSVFQTG